MADTLNILPANIIAGETIKKVISVPADADTVKYQFASIPPLEVEVTEETGVWTLTVTSAQTLTFKRGSIRFVGLSIDTDDVVTAFDSGAITVEASPMATSKYAPALLAAEEALARYVASEFQRTQLGDMSTDAKKLEDLQNNVDYYKRLVSIDTGSTNYSGGPARLLTRF